MKSFNLLMGGLLLTISTLFAQNKTMVVGGTTANPNAVLQVDAPNGDQGLLMPRVTTAQRNAMTLTVADEGMVVFDTDVNALHTWSGTAWVSGTDATNATNATTATRLAVPMSHNITSATLNSTILDWRYTGSTSANLARFRNLNATNSDTTLVVSTNGSGENAHFRVDNPGSTASTLYSVSNSLGVTLWATNTSATTGSAGFFENISPSNTVTALTTRTYGSGNAFTAVNYGTGRGGQFTIDNPANASFAVRGFTNGTGRAGYFTVSNAAGAQPALWVESNSDVFPSGSIYGLMTGTGDCAGCFRISNAGNTRVALYGETNGTGTAVFGNNIGSSGNAGTFQNAATGNSFPALYASTVGTGAAIFGSTSSGYAAIAGQRNGATNGFGGLFEVTNGGNSYQAVKATTAGTGAAIWAEIANATNNNPAVQAITNGTGAGGDFQINNASSTATALFAKTNGMGASIQGRTSTGIMAIQGVHDGAVNGHAGLFEITNGVNNYQALKATTAGTGAGILSVIANATNNSPALQGETNGTGPALLANQINGGTNDIALFQNSGSNVARIDDTGQGFFNGGTQNTGADVAELFDVEGTKTEYEPGDVLVISEDTDRTVEKSDAPNSTKVAGVYATKPGVTLTEKNLDESTDALVPMGVIGVIPTKVCLENGPIRRGDLLVTSSTIGHAMKAISKNGDGLFPAGTILGKALENFDGTEKGIIKVLVNAK